jgi:hypothetical protein
MLAKTAPLNPAKVARFKGGRSKPIKAEVVPMKALAQRKEPKQRPGLVKRWSIPLRTPPRGTMGKKNKRRGSATGKKK